MTKIYLCFVDGGHANLLADGSANPAATPGKETPFIKSLGRRIQEEEFNQPTADLLRRELARCGVRVYDPAAGVGKDVPLKQRTDYANRIYREYCGKYGAANVSSIYVSIHYNAIDGKFDGPGRDPEGFSVHIHPGTKNKAAGRLAKCIIDELKNGTTQKNRGIVEQNLHITRETAMPAVLTENGFMDNEREALLMLNMDFRKEVAIEHAKGVCKYFDIPHKPAVTVAATQPKPTQPGARPPGPKLFRVQVGAFGNKANADALGKQLTNAGFGAPYVKLDEDGLYKVQVGAFSLKSNADALQIKIRKAGFQTAYVNHN